MARIAGLLFLVVALAGCSACAKDVDPPDPGGDGPAVDPQRVEPRRVGPPAPVSQAEVERDVVNTPGMPKLTLDDFRDFVRWLDQARTLRAASHLMGVALHFAHQQPPERRQVLAREVYDAFARAQPRLEPSFTIGSEGAGECDVDFDNPAVLGTYFDDAASQIGDSTIWDEPCADGVVRVDVLKNDHIHLNFETPTDCIIDGQFGRCSAADCQPFGDPDCVAIVPADEPRDFAGHDGTTPIRIRHLAGGSELAYTMHSFANVGNEPVRVYYRTQAGEWFQWNNLAGNQAWDTSAFTVDVTEVLIVHAGTSLNCGPDWEAAEPGGCPFNTAPIFIDDVSISP